MQGNSFEIDFFLLKLGERLNGACQLILFQKKGCLIDLCTFVVTRGGRVTVKRNIFKNPKYEDFVLMRRHPSVCTGRIT